LHPELAHERIRQAAERALKLDIAPLALTSPITVSVTFQNALYADKASLIPGSRRADGRTVEWVGDDMPAVYKAFEAMTALAGAG
jgi:D-aminopeptidase